ncbi:MAG: ABC transporter ATP-binding protein [Eubacteriales bacterium]|nr:ABC transporter ATP-binding protein [Eubacteriales bacterium]
MNNILTTENLCFSVGDRELIHKISLKIPRGSFVGLIGPNGCGKSTLLKTIYRVNRASSGTVYLNGKAIDSWGNREVAKQMAVVTQENDINFDFTVMEMMQMGRYAHRKILKNYTANDEKICKEALKMVGMESFEQRSFLTLSGGEKQRVFIASAFSREAELIVLDEPTNHLDVGYQFQIMDLMKKQKNITVFSSIHDMNIAMQYCDYIIALKKGEVVSVGTPEEVLTSQMLSDLFRVRAEIQKQQTGQTYIRYLGAL